MNPIECPECGGPCESDHNSFSCHTCKRCWPKGHGWEQEWRRKDFDERHKAAMAWDFRRQCSKGGLTANG